MGKSYFMIIYNIIAVILSAMIIPAVWGVEPAYMFLWFFIWISTNFILYGIHKVLNRTSGQNNKD